MPTANPIAQASFSSATYSYYGLLSDGDDVKSQKGTVASGIGVLVRGTIVNWDPATGAITVPTTVAGCNAILVNDIDSTAATVPAQVYTVGSFKADAITWPGALSHALVTDQLRDYGMLIEAVMYTDGSIVKSAPSQAEEDAAKKRIEENKAAIEKAEKAAKETKEESKDEPKPSDSPWAHLTPDDREKHPEYAAPAVWTGEPAPGSEAPKQPAQNTPSHTSGGHTPKR